MTRRTWTLLALAVLSFTLFFGLAVGRAGILRAHPGPGMHHNDGPGMMHGGGMMPQGSLEGLTGDAFDRAFLQQMIMHHAMGVVMTRPVAERAVHPELRALAEQIITGQTREIAQMRGWLKDWYGVEAPDPLAMMAGMPATGRGPGMMGGMMNGQWPGWGMGGMHGTGTMPMWGDLTPARLEVGFMSMMIPHHQAAIDMAALAGSRAAHDELKALAAAIVTSQSAENATMAGWLKEWYGL